MTYMKCHIHVRLCDIKSYSLYVVYYVIYLEVYVIYSYIYVFICKYLLCHIRVLCWDIYLIRRGGFENVSYKYLHINTYIYEYMYISSMYHIRRGQPVSMWQTCHSHDMSWLHEMSWLSRCHSWQMSFVTRCHIRRGQPVSQLFSTALSLESPAKPHLFAALVILRTHHLHITYTYTHTYICKHMNTYVYIRICVFICIYLNITYTHTHIYICMNI